MKNDIEIRMLRQCNSPSEAKYWETKFIPFFALIIFSIYAFIIWGRCNN